MFVGCDRLVGGGCCSGMGGPPFHCVVVVLCRSCGCCEKGMGNGQALT